LLVPRDRRKRAVLVTITIVPIVIAVLWVGMFAASKVTGWDFYSKMEERVLTLLPQGNDRVQSAAAWDTRTQGIAAELGIWSENPISGRGFGIQESRGLGDFDIGVHHNAWTDILAKTGIVGLIPYMLVLFGSISVGIKMVRDRTDRSFILVGAFSAILGFFYIVLGLTTWSFNGLRPAILIGSTFGLMLRCREIQLAHAERFELTVPELSTEPAMAYT
jgi:O-antigen ligase